jgi:hypothetical protein
VVAFKAMASYDVWLRLLEVVAEAGSGGGSGVVGLRLTGLDVVGLALGCQALTSRCQALTS